MAPQSVRLALCLHLLLFAFKITFPRVHHATPSTPSSLPSCYMGCEVSIRMWKVVEVKDERKLFVSPIVDQHSRGSRKGWSPWVLVDVAPISEKEDNQWGMCDAFTLSSISWSPFVQANPGSALTSSLVNFFILDVAALWLVALDCSLSFGNFCEFCFFFKSFAIPSKVTV